jgi:hypothetical protein
MNSSSVFLVHQPLELAAGACFIQRAGEGWIGEDQAVLVFLVSALFRERIAILHVGVLHPVEEHVHRANAQHGFIEIKAMEQAMVEVLP